MTELSKTDEIKAMINRRVKEFDGKAKEGLEKLWGQAQAVHDSLLDKTSSLYAQMLLKAEEHIKEHREVVESGELREQIINRIKEGLKKLEENPEDVSDDEMELLALDMTSDLTMLWYHRDFMQRKIKEAEEDQGKK